MAMSCPCPTGTRSVPFTRCESRAIGPIAKINPRHQRLPRFSRRRKRKIAARCVGSRPSSARRLPTGPLRDQPGLRSPSQRPPHSWGSMSNSCEARGRSRTGAMGVGNPNRHDSANSLATRSFRNHSGNNSPAVPPRRSSSCRTAHCITCRSRHLSGRVRPR